MNYRHHFHAGNFADVAKHTLLVQLVRAMQRKEKGFLYLDTHAGRGRYDLATAKLGDSLARKPEHPDGIGRLLVPSAMANVHPAILDYVNFVNVFNGYPANGTQANEIRFYPGSPCFAHALARPQDRLVLCEKHPEEFAELKIEFSKTTRVSVQHMDGYTAMRAMLPPPEKRALILIDPPFESQDEFASIASSLREGLRRTPAATFAIWYPMTERADVEAFFAKLEGSDFPPTLTAELVIAGKKSPLKMRGSGLVVINPPWEIDKILTPVLHDFGKILGQDAEANGTLRWIVAER